MHRMIRYLFLVLGICALLAGILMTWFITGFSGFKNSFRGDTQHAWMQLNILEIKGSTKDVYAYNQMHQYENQSNKVVEAKAPPLQLPMGAEGAYSVSLSQTEFYNEGGGIIFSGKKYYGNHPVYGDFLSAKSSHTDVVSATVDRSGRLWIKALSPGTSTIVLTARRTHLDVGNRKPQAVTDSIEVTVLPVGSSP